MASPLTNNPAFNYFKTSYQELRKVTWPTRQDATRHAALVVAISLIVAAFFGVLDYLLNLILERLIG